MAHRRNSAVIPCADTGSWGALGGVTTTQCNTTHKATQDSRSEAGMTW